MIQNGLSIRESDKVIGFHISGRIVMVVLQWLARASGVRICSSSRCESPAKARFDYNFGRMLDVWFDLSAHIKVVVVSI